MAPNAEEELLVVRSWGPQPEKERLRPPTYNAEDYAIALRRWGRRPLPCVQDSQDTLPSTTSSSSGYASGNGEMTLRQFTSVSELLNKLRADLRLAFPSFVQEFASPPADGITLLLETLRGVQLAQSSPPGGRIGPRVATRRVALDELGCVECLAACAERCSDAPRLLVQAQPGLLALAVCLTSSLNRSRVLALQLLTKVCQSAGGHAAVSEAVSTLRLKYGEGGRFRFLAGALLAPRAAIALRVAGVSFLNAFLKSAPRTQSRLYIQAEACEAGLEPEVLQEWLRESDSHEEDTLTELLRNEIQKWTRNCVDVDALQRRALRAEETCRILNKKVSALQLQLYNMQLDKLSAYDSENRDEVKARKKILQQMPSNAEDEGISSSERSSSPENSKEQSSNRREITDLRDNDQETTIDDVIEELRIIVKDAEEEFSDKTAAQDRSALETCSSDRVSTDSRNRKPSNNAVPPDNQVDSSVPKSRGKGERVTYFGNERDESTTSSVSKKFTSFRDTRGISRASSNEGSVRVIVKGAANCEDAIVPAILHPQPPRRSVPCLSAMMAARQHEDIYNSYDEEELEEETLGDGSDSLLSASRLKYNEKNRPDHENHARVETNASSKHFRKLTTRKRDEEEEEVETKSIRRVSKHCASKYRSEVEKRKHLRRSNSHDYLESSSFTDRSKTTNKVECRVKKFESLSSFDDPFKWRMRRSESFHHVSHISSKDRREIVEGSRSGSDSAFIYITDFNLDPLVAPNSPTLHAKSLDRIDEGLDSMVNIVITEEKNRRNATRQRSKFGDLTTGETTLIKGHLSNDEIYKQLMNDELYEDRRSKPFANFPNINTSDSAIFAGHKQYDSFGIGKGRFNAGKYSGEQQQQQQQQQQQRKKDDPSIRRNTTSSLVGKRGKVTDVVSGLY